MAVNLGCLIPQRDGIYIRLTPAVDSDTLASLDIRVAREVGVRNKVKTFVALSITDNVIDISNSINNEV